VRHCSFVFIDLNAFKNYYLIESFFMIPDVRSIFITNCFIEVIKFIAVALI